MYMFETMELQVKEEYVIYDFVGMISSIGGNLGLFIGFSFFDAFCWLVDLIQKWISKISSGGKVVSSNSVITNPVSK